MTSAGRLDQHLLELVRDAAGRYGDKTFLVFGDGSNLTFAGFDRRVAAFRSLLAKNGVQPGDRVALMMKNSLDYSAAWLGVVTSGAAAVPTNSRLKESDARFIFEHSGATAALVDDSTSEVASAAAPEALRTFLFSRDADDGEAMPRVEHELQPETIANIQYTSGTTGFPKGCLLTHGFWQRMASAAAQVMLLSPDDTLLTSQPHSYIDPQWQVVLALQTGARLVLLDSFHPSTFMANVARFEVSVFYCLGVMPSLLLKQPPAPTDHRHSVKRIYCSAVPVERHEEIERRWGVPWIEVFGMTETGINTAVPLAEHERFVGTGCIGRALEHNEAKVVDADGRSVAPGTPGELVLRGTGFMDGYYEDPDATAAFFRDGWAHTGDLVVQDEDGFIFYRGRLKEMIRRAGENISPVEIETALGAHPDVIECAVSPVPDPDLGEEIKAYVVLRPGADEAPESLADYLRDRIARFKVPRYWEYRSELPHTPSERIAKHELERDRSDFSVDTTDLMSRGHRPR